MEKLSMGEYGFEVWTAYAVAFVVLSALAWSSVRALRKSQAELKRLEE